MDLKDKESLAQTLEKLKLTQKEQDKLKEAFKDKKFVELFEEYAKEVQDPKVRAEQEEYFSQLERQGQVEEVYGKGVQIIQPQEGIVFKTQIDCEGKTFKSFINVCTSEKVDKYKVSNAQNNGSKGTCLEVPIVQSRRKEDKDVKNNTCCIYDVVVNPLTLQDGMSNRRFLSFLIDTICERLENVDKNMKISRNVKQLNKKYHACQGYEKPQSYAIRDQNQAIEKRQEDINNQSKKYQDKLKKENNQAGQNQKLNETHGSNFGLKFENNIKDPTKPGFKHEDGSITPNFKLVHRGEQDLNKAWSDNGRNLNYDHFVPKELVLKVEMPGLVNVSQVQLDISPQKIQLVCKSLAYKLDLKLPYKVNNQPTPIRQKVQQSAVQEIHQNHQQIHQAELKIDNHQDNKQQQNPISSIQLCKEEYDNIQEKQRTPQSQNQSSNQDSENCKSEEGMAVTNQQSSQHQDIQQNEVQADLSENQKRWKELHNEFDQQFEKEQRSLDQRLDSIKEQSDSDDSDYESSQGDEAINPPLDQYQLQNNQQQIQENLMQLKSQNNQVHKQSDQNAAFTNGTHNTAQVSEKESGNIKNVEEQAKNFSNLVNTGQQGQSKNKSNLIQQQQLTNSQTQLTDQIDHSSDSNIKGSNAKAEENKTDTQQINQVATKTTGNQNQSTDINNLVEYLEKQTIQDNLTESSANDVKKASEENVYQNQNYDQLNRNRYQPQFNMGFIDELD